MGESTSQIERDIAAERNELGRNLQLLESKARSMADWRTHFRKHPFMMMGIAVAGGAMLGALSSRSAAPSSDRGDWDYEAPQAAPRMPEPSYARPSALSASAARVRRQFGSTWDVIAEALLGVASVKAIEFVSDLVPGFREQFDARNPDHPRSFSSGDDV